jgi:hypothetical protein
MFTSNPFAELTAFLSPQFMRIYIVVMILAVAIGTVVDMFHKRSFEFFMLRKKNSQAKAKRQLSGGERFSLMLKTLGKEVLTSGEFCNVQRRISHLLLFYGFLLYIVSTLAMVYGYPTPATPTPGIWLFAWNLGAAMILAGGGWFFFFLRVNVAYEQDPPYRIIPADLFVGSLLLSALFALIWEIVQGGGNPAATQIFFGIYIFFTTVLFVTVPWSKFAHMFYKPTAAYQRRIEEATETDSLPREARGQKQVASPTRTYSARR